MNRFIPGPTTCWFLSTALSIGLAFGTTTVPTDSRQHDFYFGGAVVAAVVATVFSVRLR